MTRKLKNLQTIHDSKIIAIIRAKDSNELLKAVEALSEGGVKVIEVSMNTPNALRVIEAAAARFRNDAVLGVGTVLDPATARQAIDAGAELVVAPVFNPEVVELCRRYSCVVIPGALTPTEILAAWQAGADLVKVFPTVPFGPPYIKAVKQPLPQVDLVAVGGVELENAAEFIKAGCAAVGVGSSLVNNTMLGKGDWAGLRQRAAEFVAACSG